MCGICGFVGNVEDTVFQRMLNVLSHRGPDDRGYTQFRGETSEMKVSLGHTRLSIIDLSPSGHQPMSNEDDTVWIVYNGEIYNFREISKGLKTKGHKFKSKSDTEVIIHAYEEWGESCVQYLNGMFAFAIWDKKKERLFIARDRLGIKPLYYWVGSNKFIFASEIKAILEYREFEKKVDPKTLFHFMTFLYIPSPLSIFKGIKKLPPAHTLTLEKHKVEIKKYWDLAFRPRSPDFHSKLNSKSEEYYKKQIMVLLQDVLESHMISDAPLGAFLSGGIDSSAVVGLMSKLCPEPVKTFSIGYEGKGEESYNELKYARIVSKYYGTDHQEFILKPEMIDLLPKIVWHLDEPFADLATIPTYLVSEAASQYVKVALTGIGGDEVFGGYPRYLGARISQLYVKLPLFVRKLLVIAAETLPESGESRNIPGWVKRFMRGSLLPEDERYISWVSSLTNHQSSQLFTEDFLSSISDFSVNKTHKTFYAENSANNILEKIFYLDIKTYLADDLLMMGDKMSMAHSLEIRVPFCDHKLIEFAATIPTELKFKGLKLKSLLKESLAGLLPEEILQRKKQGFMVPMSKWFQNELKDFTMDLLSEERIRKRGYFRPDFIKLLLRQHYRGKQDFTDQIYALISLELWHQVFMD
ncbi:MAG: asparagine synthase (glutamine-hydrolyzing) [Candidatus Brocadiales bacterium]|nr:asparagine synthase (glutamine-hydrolyzing) [Candidatus Brocadiales bacterium]